MDLEDYGMTDETDTDDDFWVSSTEGIEVTSLGLSKLQTINLDFPSAFLPPDSPPPKRS